MAVDEGLRDTYLTRLRNELDRLRGELGATRERVRLAQLAHDAQALLTPADVEILLAAKILDGDRLPDARANREQRQAEVQALQNLIDAVRGMVAP